MKQFDVARALAYAATAQQIEISDATIAIYLDQLRNYEPRDLERAVREWVRTYEEPYRRLPAVGELRAIMRSGRAQMDPQTKHEIRVAGLVNLARQQGWTRDRIDKLTEKLDAEFYGVICVKRG